MFDRELTKFLVGSMLVFFPTVIIFSAFIKPYFKTIERKNWVQVPCSVVSCEISQSGGGVDSSGDSNLRIVYTYTYDNMKFTGKTIDNYPSSGQGWELAKKYEEMFCSSAAVQVYVNPEDPSDAVLYRDYFRPTSEVKRFLFIPFYILIYVPGIWLVIRGIIKFSSRFYRHSTGL